MKQRIIVTTTTTHIINITNHITALIYITTIDTRVIAERHGRLARTTIIVPITTTTTTIIITIMTTTITITIYIIGATM